MLWQHRWFLPITFALLTLVFFVPALLSDQRAFAGSDFQQIHYPLLKFVVDSVRNDGVIPLWNPHQFLGYSVAGNPQYGLFYPPNWLLLLFPGAHVYRGIALLVALHTFWASLGTAYLARLYGAERRAAFLAGILVGFGGFPASRLYAGHYAVLLTLAWLPWIMAGYRLAVQKCRVFWIIPGAMALGLAILAGHPQFVYIAGLGVALQCLFESLNQPRARITLAAGTTLQLQRPHNLSLQPTRQLVLLVGIGLVLSAVTWLPALDYQSKTVRGVAPDSLAFANQHALPPRQLITLLVPNLFGSPVENPPGYWGEPFYEEMTAYVGILPVVLLPLVFTHRQRTIWFFTGLALFGVVLSLGKDAILYRVLYELIPPVRDFRAPGRSLALTSLGLALVLALNLTELTSDSPAKYRYRLRLLIRRFLLPPFIMLSVAAMVLKLKGDSLQDVPERASFMATQLAWSAGILLLAGLLLWLWTTSSQHLSKTAALLLILLAIVDVWRVAWPLQNTGEVALSPVWQAASSFIPTTTQGQYGRVIQMLAPPGIINGASWTGHLSPQGYDPVAPDGWFRLMDAQGRFIEDPGSAVNRIFGVRYVIAGQPLENYGFASTQFFELIGTSGPYYYYENDLALPRTYLVKGYQVESDGDVARQRITSGEVDRGDVVLLAHDPACAISGHGGTATITIYEPNRVIIVAEADGPGLLVLTDQYDDDWQATVDGKSATVWQANTATRAVCIPNGQHLVEFRYRPWSVRAGAAISGLAWLGLALGVGVTIYYHRHVARTPGLW